MAFGQGIGKTTMGRNIQEGQHASVCGVVVEIQFLLQGSCSYVRVPSLRDLDR